MRPHKILGSKLMWLHNYFYLIYHFIINECCFESIQKIVEQRGREILDKQLEESPSGFKKGRNCQNHIFTSKQISEKT